MNVWRSGALKGLWGIAIALSVALGSAVLAQENTPVSSLATLEAGEFSALAITLNGERMLVADTANNTARLYDISDPQDPSQLDSIALEGPPLALAPTLEYAIAIIDTGTDHDLAQVIAPALFNPRAGWEATRCWMFRQARAALPSISAAHGAASSRMICCSCLNCSTP